MAAAGVCDITPVEGVTVSVRGGAHNSFEVEWRDMRCLPTSSDADVSRNATPRAFLDSTRTVHGLVAILHKIVFGEGQDDTGKATEFGGAAADPASFLTLQSGWAIARAGMVEEDVPVFVQQIFSSLVESGIFSAEASAGGALTIYLQRRRSRAVMRRVAVTPDGSGQAMTVTVYNGANATVLRQVAPWGFLAQLSEMCSGDDGFVLVRETCWSELPSELWWHVLKCLTRREGKAVSCTCKMISHMVQLPAFVWAPAQLHLGLVQAQEAVRSDTSTHLPLNITDQEVRIGRSRRNDVVLLRDPEVSKKHCKLWRDARGDVWIQDLASTNGTKLNGEWLRPAGGDSSDIRQPSEPRKLKVDDQVVLGLTTLALHDGPCPVPAAAAAGDTAMADGEGAADNSVNSPNASQ